MGSSARNDLPGRIVGMVIFLLGVGLLLIVFYISYGFFTGTPEHALGFRLTGNVKRDPGASQIGYYFAWVLCRIALLFVMSVSGSLISQKGINLYFSAVQGVPVNVTARPSATVSASPEA